MTWCSSLDAMGITVGRMDSSLQRHRFIEQSIKEDRKKNASVLKLLLLGTRESGKSTVVKQMRILRGKGFDENEIDRLKAIIAHNILSAMAAILKAMRELEIELENPARQAEASVIIKAEENWKPGFLISSHEWSSIKLLWSDEGVQQCFLRSNEYQLCDSAIYFFNNLDRVSSKGYVPNQDDVLRARESTYGIVELGFPLNNLTLKLIDVGGQRSERKKWIHCFEGVTSVIFVASLSEYNQNLFEDANMNRMQESLKLFETVCNCHWFRDSAFILFLNKKDLFAQKLKSFPLTLCFPEYTGEKSYEECVSYVEDQYYRQNDSKKKLIYGHKTCATDTDNIKFVMDASLDIILAANLADAGLVPFRPSHRTHSGHGHMTDVFAKTI